MSEKKTTGKSRDRAKGKTKKRKALAPELPPGPERITRGLLDHVAGVARACGASAVLVYLDALEGKALELPRELGCRVFYVARTSSERDELKERRLDFLRVPNVPLTRMGQVKIAIFRALSRGVINRGDVIVCLSGRAASGSLDTIVVTQVGRELEILVSPAEADRLPRDLLPEVAERVVDIATELGAEGREGKPVGGMFVVGDSEKVTELSRQLIMNPFRGYPDEERNILDPGLEETVKELAGIDGAFIVRGDGVIETCGAYIRTASQEGAALPRGLGARHHAAAGITAVTDAVAVTISESTGNVTIFREGRIVTEIEKPRSAGQVSDEARLE